jgi:hypothetical protein
VVVGDHRQVDALAEQFLRRVKRSPSRRAGWQRLAMPFHPLDALLDVVQSTGQIPRAAPRTRAQQQQAGQRPRMPECRLIVDGSRQQRIGRGGRGRAKHRHGPPFGDAQHLLKRRVLDARCDEPRFGKVFANAARIVEPVADHRAQQQRVRELHVVAEATLDVDVDRQE